MGLARLFLPKTGYMSSNPPIKPGYGTSDQKKNTKDYIAIVIQVGREFANGPGDPSSIPHRVIPKTLKMVVDTTLLNTQQYKVCIKGKVEKSKERSSALP